MHTDYYVYMYLRDSDSNIANAGTPYYIGKGRGKRFIDKRRRIKIPSDRKNIVFHTTNLSEEDAFKLEIQLISFYGRIDIGTGILRNMSSGGEGASGRVFSEDHKKKLSESKKGEKHPKGMLGKTHSLETRKKMSEKQSKENNPMFGKTLTEDHKKKLSDSKKGKTYRRTPEHCAAISKSKKGEKHPMWGKKQEVLTCPHCNKKGGRTMVRWHFDKCKEK